MNERIAGYADAIFDLATAEGELERVESELLAIGQAFQGSEDLRAALTDPALPTEKKRAVIDDLIGGRAANLTVALVDLIVAMGRAGEIPAMASSFIERAVASRSKALAEVRSPIPLDDPTVKRLAAALSKATGQQVEVKVIVDESVIGGLVARVGDVVIDGSLANSLNELRHTVLSR